MSRLSRLQLEEGIGLALTHIDAHPGAGGLLRRQAIARIGLALMDRLGELDPSLLAPRELLLRQLPPVERARRELLRIVRILGLDLRRLGRFLPERPSGSRADWLGKHAGLALLLAKERVPPGCVALRGRLERIHATFSVAQDEELERAP
jgi:hypothetical protein